LNLNREAECNWNCQPVKGAVNENDVVLALIKSRDPKQYIQRMKQRDPELGKGWVQFVHTLSVPTGL